MVFVLVFKPGNALDYGKKTAGERIGKWQHDVLRRYEGLRSNVTLGERSQAQG